MEKFFMILKQTKDLLGNDIKLAEAIVSEEKVTEYSDRDDIEIFPLSDTFNKEMNQADQKSGN